MEEKETEEKKVWYCLIQQSSHYGLKKSWTDYCTPLNARTLEYKLLLTHVLKQAKDHQNPAITGQPIVCRAVSLQILPLHQMLSSAVTVTCQWWCSLLYSRRPNHFRIRFCVFFSRSEPSWHGYAVQARFIARYLKVGPGFGTRLKAEFLGYKQTFVFGWMKSVHLYRGQRWFF